jgi:hypothetical protein
MHLVPFPQVRLVKGPGPWRVDWRTLPRHFESATLNKDTVSLFGACLFRIPSI